MIKIGLLSDTHSHIDEKMLTFFSGVDEIWHAGDIGSLEVADKLSKLTKTRCVFGNIDDHRIRQEFNNTEIFEIENISVFITHIGGYPQKYAPGILQQLKQNGTKLFISGHSHILKVIFDKKLECLHINPGAAGIQGMHHVRTMVRFSISGDKIENLEIWEHPR